MQRYHIFSPVLAKAPEPETRDSNKHLGAGRIATWSLTGIQLVDDEWWLIVDLH
jgi:hypothetical protein